MISRWQILTRSDFPHNVIPALNRWWRRWHCPYCREHQKAVGWGMSYRQRRHFAHGRWLWSREWHNHPDTWGRTP